MAENVLSTDYKYFPAIIVAICVGGKYAWLRLISLLD